MADKKTFTGRTRLRKTSPAVWWTDRAARALISVGGIGTIVAVLLVCIFLVVVASPLFQSAVVESEQSFDPLWVQEQPWLVAMDEYRLIGWALLPNGEIRAFSLNDGRPMGEPIQVRADEEANGEMPELTAATVTPEGALALGFSDGSFRTGDVSFSTQYIDIEHAPQSLRPLEIGAQAKHDGGVAVRTAGGQIRVQKLAVKLEKRLAGKSKSAIVLVDYTSGSRGPLTCTLTADGHLSVNSVSKRLNLLTDEETITVSSGTIPLPATEGQRPAYLAISGLGDGMFVAYRSGRLLRYSLRDLEKPVLAEELDLVPESGEELTALRFLLGRATLIAGDSLGRVRAWFATTTERQTTQDDIALALAHDLPPAGAPVTAIAMSSRERTVAAGYANGLVRMYFVTSEQQFFEQHLPAGDPVELVSISPKSDTVLALTRSGIHRWDFDPRHPEITLATLLAPVWYEGYNQANLSWQTSSGTDKFEAKYSLTPLIYGTLKATFYSMLFGAPLAILAAIFTSEFLQPRWRARIKPTVEMMASLPSVVLGFIAGLVIAPAIEDIVPTVLVCFFTVPFAFLCGAQLWRLLPGGKSIQLARWRFPLMLLAALPLGILVGAWIGPLLESTSAPPFVSWMLFNGDFKEWLNHLHGSAVPGWILILLPASGMLVAWLVSAYVNPHLRTRTSHWTRRRAAFASFLIFDAGAVLAVFLAAAMGFLLDQLHLDPRGGVLDTYVQRNALVVGFIMGFAIIPIIYTIADDALTGVPEHLRSASLGTGATPWQTATRIIIPTAMSGLFSALMIGLGRAVGETMIVLMAAGNTPIMEWNIFNGFQTLSAAIATELPEAPRDSTHYRVLFLAALSLFAMTFLVNTAAEVVRQRFRRRAYEL